ncbi:MAG: hydroxymethylglutaryl-CoA reductase [Candidatus Aenigmarchaeota archaeon]|nr:hydroxymethylglutaryl-CoA reductase [Candidatus Aenigmarchaeota archaeon]
MDEEKLIEQLNKGEIKLHEVEDIVNDSGAATEIRRKYLEKKYGMKLEHVSKSSIDFADSINRNIENPVGTIQVPLGCAGEVKINGVNANGLYPILLATTEGRLVAGMSRGINVFNAAGGVNTTIIKDGITRSLILRTKGAKDAVKLIRWVESEEGFNFLSEAFSKSTKHGKLKEIKCYTPGRDVFLRFKAFTGAAMGMNMVTIAAEAAVEELIDKIKEFGIDAVLISESGNMCTDKKPAYINILEGRGVSLIADALIPREVVEREFRVTPEAVAELNKTKNLQGSALAGSHGFNAHVANVLAAMYIAHGQDVAQIVEGAQAMTDVAVVDGDMYVSLFLPSVEVGTFGGGTKRETQQEVLRLLGLYGENDTEGITRLTFAEIVAAACLVSEINLLAIQSAKELAKSHYKLRRG